MPTLLQISVEGNRGSTGTIAEDIGILIQNEGWESYIAHGRFSRPSKSKLIHIETWFGVLLHVLQTRLFDRHCLGSVSATKNLIKRIVEINPDIIHLHHIHGYYINMVILFNFLKEAEIPVVWTFHDCWSFTGHCAYFDYINCNKWKTECNHCPQKNEYPKSVFWDRSKKNFYLKKKLFLSLKNMIIVPVSNWLDGLIKESFLSEKQTRMIHNGIDLNIFQPIDKMNFRKKYFLENQFIILGVASPWVKRKGLKDFIELSKILEENQKIVLVGLEKNQIRHLPENIIGLERTESREQLAELYSTSDVFINPTWEDNYPTTNMESTACGTPVITYKTGGSTESVFDSTGFVAEKGDICEIKRIIDKVQKEGKHKYVLPCREAALQYFDKLKKYADYINLYKELISKV